MESLRGRLLLASPEMGDPNFEHSVILMVQHGPEGAMGLVLNRPTGTRVAEVLGDQVEAACDTDEMLYRGGPCEGPLMVLHGDPVHGQEKILDDLFFATEREYVEPALHGNVSPARFYAGYSGWGAGQLEGELAAGAWSVIETNAASVLRSTPGEQANVWRKLIRVKSSAEFFKHWDPRIVPRDPSMN
ncbi:MAG: YqgE/AlgH family protein [Planctomycetota bacterium]